MPAPLPLPTAPSWARRPRAATTGVERARDDPWVIVPACWLLLRRRVGGCLSAALPAVRWCAARRSDGPSCGRRATPAGTRRCGGGGGTPLPASRAPRHGSVAVRAPVGARGYGAGRRTRCRCVAERATARLARVSHARAWNFELPRKSTSIGARRSHLRWHFGDEASLSDPQNAIRLPHIAIAIPKKMTIGDGDSDAPNDRNQSYVPNHPRSTESSRVLNNPLLFRAS